MRENDSSKPRAQQSRGDEVAVIVNDMSEVNIDATVKGELFESSGGKIVEIVAVSAVPCGGLDGQEMYGYRKPF